MFARAARITQLRGVAKTGTLVYPIRNGATICHFSSTGLLASRALSDGISLKVSEEEVELKKPTSEASLGSSTRVVVATKRHRPMIVCNRIA